MELEINKYQNPYKLRLENTLNGRGKRSTIAGTLTEGESLVQLTSSLRWLVV